MSDGTPRDRTAEKGHRDDDEAPVTTDNRVAPIPTSFAFLPPVPCEALPPDALRSGVRSPVGLVMARHAPRVSCRPCRGHHPRLLCRP